MRNVFIKTSILLITILILSMVIFNTKVYAYDINYDTPNVQWLYNHNDISNKDLNSFCSDPGIYFAYSYLDTNYNVIEYRVYYFNQNLNFNTNTKKFTNYANRYGSSIQYFNGNLYYSSNGIDLLRWELPSNVINIYFFNISGGYKLSINGSIYEPKEKSYISIKSIKFLNYTNTGSKFGLVTNLDATENDNFIFWLKGNLQYKFYPPNLLNSIIEHYEWTEEEDIYNAFKENGQFLIETDYNYFMQRTNPIEYDLPVELNRQTSIGVLGDPIFYDLVGLFPDTGTLIQQIYGIDNTLSDLQVLLAAFTIYPYIWNNKVYPNSTIIFNWSTNNILNSYPTIELPPDWEPTPGIDESTIDITYTHDEQDYIGRSSDILNAYYSNLPFDMIEETTSFLGRVMNIIPSPIKYVLIFFIIAGVIVGVICIARE